METKRISSSYTITSLLTIVLTYSSSFFPVFSQQPTCTSVLDMDGNHVQTNTKYYIFGLGGGGLALSIRDRRDPCPPTVMQEHDEVSVGLSLKIFTVNKQEITLDTDLNIVFMAATTCVQSTVWRLGNIDPFTGRRYVRSAGVLGKPGPETVRNWFKLERFGEGYKIVYCPSVCSTCRVDCGDVGVFVENGARWLGLGGQPLEITFKKAKLLV